MSEEDQDEALNVWPEQARLIEVTLDGLDLGPTEAVLEELDERGLEQVVHRRGRGI